jgi:hypothetical protein
MNALLTRYVVLSPILYFFHFFLNLLFCLLHLVLRITV